MDISKLLLDKKISDEDKKKIIYNNKSYVTQESVLMVNKFLRKYPTNNGLNIAILRSYSLEPAIPFFEAFLRVDKYEPKIELGGYNQFQQEIMANNSFIYNINFDFIYIAIRLEELSNKLTDEFMELTNNEIEKEVSNIIDLIISLLKKIRERVNTPIIINNFIVPAYGKFGIYETSSPLGEKETVKKINSLLITKIKDNYQASLLNSVYILDIDKLAAEIGHRNFFDKRMYYISRVPYSGEGLLKLAEEFSKFIRTLKGKRKKCIVLDCDNTLWGGIVGEDGLNGIKLGEEYPGICYKEFQKQLLNYKRKGFVLAINSKNNYDDVIEVFEKHPHQILKKNDFVSLRINWKDKAENMREIAEELNIGLDTFVFIDDSKVECEMIKFHFPEVQIVNLPSEPFEISNILENMEGLDLLSFTMEDTKKSKQYLSNIKRRELKGKLKNIEDFYYSLEMEMEIKKEDKSSLERLAQLTQKTNQFNLTTKRYTEVAIVNFINSNRYSVYQFSLMDKFGDNGIVGLAIIKINEEIAEFDTFLMSCRVISRTAEENFITAILGDLKKSGYQKVFGEWIKTKKNNLVANFFDKMGFKVSEKRDDYKKYVLEIADKNLKYNDWIKVIKNF